ncbi:hypothetical protein [Pseudomonas japonica]|uniref:hypothetical protein n=1 Tax=Pseudomonas japonica TaxID=256466 RepID=UPI0015E339B3|nr:hypothetical protein [Pseudomonas japonica]MBA1245442.1 hypothetical protein [Pseudomonas japonica]
MDTWYRFPLGQGAAEYQALREVRQLRLRHESARPDVAFPVLLDQVDVSLWLYLPPGNDALAKELKGVPCPSPEEAPGRLVKLSEEYHPAHPPLRMPRFDSLALDVGAEALGFPAVGPDPVLPDLSADVSPSVLGTLQPDRSEG